VSTLTEPHIHLGNVTHTRQPAAVPVAFCDVHGAACLWAENNGHVRADGIAHAQQQRHRVIVVEGFDRTPIEVTW
jgi:hypothetical protein